MQTVHALARTSWGGYGCGLIFCIAPIYMGGRLGSWIASLISPDAESLGFTIGAFVTFACCAAVIVSMFSLDRKHRALCQRDLDDAVVQDVIVSDAPVVSLEVQRGNLDSVLAFQLDSTTMLVLAGEWLTDPETYGAPVPPDDDSDADPAFNGLRPPHQFPASRFTLTMLPRSGEALGIKVTGPYTEPSPGPEVDPSLLPTYCAVIPGTFDTLPSALRAFADSRGT